MKAKFLTLLLLILCFASCKQLEYIEVPRVETVYKTNTIHDSVDRWRTHYEFIKGDTVYSVDTLYRATYHRLHDTCLRTDTLTVTVTDQAATARLQAQLAQSQKKLAWAYLIIFIISLAVVCAVILYIRKKAWLSTLR